MLLHHVRPGLVGSPILAQIDLSRAHALGAQRRVIEQQHVHELDPRLRRDAIEPRRSAGTAEQLGRALWPSKPLEEAVERTGLPPRHIRLVHPRGHLVGLTDLIELARADRASQKAGCSCSVAPRSAQAHLRPREPYRVAAPSTAENHLVDALVGLTAFAVLAPEYPCDTCARAQRPSPPLVDPLDQRDLAAHWLALLAPAVECGLRAAVESDLAQKPPDMRSVDVAPRPAGSRVDVLDAHGAEQLAAAGMKLVETVDAQSVQANRGRHVEQLDETHLAAW